jgi:hypothetical protein
VKPACGTGWNDEATAQYSCDRAIGAKGRCCYVGRAA